LLAAPLAKWCVSYPRPALWSIA